MLVILVGEVLDFRIVALFIRWVREVGIEFQHSTQEVILLAHFFQVLKLLAVQVGHQSFDVGAGFGFVLRGAAVAVAKLVAALDQIGHFLLDLLVTLIDGAFHLRIAHFQAVARQRQAGLGTDQYGFEVVGGRPDVVHPGSFGPGGQQRARSVFEYRFTNGFEVKSIEFVQIRGGILRGAVVERQDDGYFFLVFRTEAGQCGQTQE